MRVARVKKVIQNGRRIFVIISVQDIAFNQIPGIDGTLKKMALNKFFILRRKTDPGAEKRFD